MTTIRKVAIIGAGGNFGTPITQALRAAGFDLTIISRVESQTRLPNDIPVIRTSYDIDGLSAALSGQDAVICVIAPAGMSLQTTIIDAAEAAGVRRFVVDEFGRAPGQKGLADFEAIGAPRKAVLRHAAQKATLNPGFSWSAVAIGHPFDWALRKFPTMGFDIARRSAIIYDKGSEPFTGVTLAGIGQAVVGILQNPGDTANRHLCVRSLQTCQNDILAAFEAATKEAWNVERSTSAELLVRGRAKRENGAGGWVLDLVVGQLYEEGAGNSVVVEKEKSDNKLLGVVEEDLKDVVNSILADGQS